ncbi:MAG: hypothetical protein JSV62_10705 [Promethearchaeota archaeon]|nr:MAG: hypothetical protein JSV62_10705 [Candidatus Lokiarchaeota archaeon]
MKSNIPRKIVIKDSKLRKVRKNLREILKLAYFTEFEKWSNLDDIYREKHLNGKITLSQEKRWFFLSQQHDKLRAIYDKSILECNLGAACLSHRELMQKGEIDPSDRSTDLDMVWVPYFKAWFCLRCYEEYFKIKACENCCKTDEKTAEISECSFCSKYICEICLNYCLECGDDYCDICYKEHLIRGRCCFTLKEDTTQIKFL